ncbi:Alpha-1-2-mannosidase [Penicillium paradoxum]|uniref:Alpha-1-2-mannosidase n=1 Tax=Penicillium paradoxum TaxID=176176 RepID=UPI002547FD6A|nr:Alpha-1-2-mannosidase [Penicillium paradoxum]KAJ5781294.1 Alpha-1-2-mannosidase [Penicillium paradoxum]
MVGMLPVLLAGLVTSVYSQPTKGTQKDAQYHSNAGVLKFVNPLIGTYGTTPNGNGGMIPSVCPPFGMTRWTPQTRENFISQVPYGDSDRLIHGFQATHQPAIWMGEAGQVVLTPGMGEVQPLFQNRGLEFRKRDERSTPYVYEVLVDATQRFNQNWNATAEAVGDGPVPGGAGAVPDDVQQGANGRTRKREVDSVPLRSSDGDEYERSIQVAMSADSHVGHLRFDFKSSSTDTDSKKEPWVFIQASRRNWTGAVHVDPKRREVYGHTTERQDYLLGPDKAQSFRGYFDSFTEYGVTNGGSVTKDATERHGNFTGAYVKFADSTARVEVRIGVSYISIVQARKNLDIQTPDEYTFQDTIKKVKAAWLEKLGRVSIQGINKTDPEHDPRTIWYTGLFHALQYPNDFSEPTSKEDGAPRVFYSGYTDSFHTENDSYYQSWSIWDTYRAEHSLLTLFAPERVNGMMRSLLRIFDWTGWLPMWANLVETNIMIATNADVVLANALERGFKGFDVQKAWQAVKQDAFTPPENDTDTLYYDREPGTSYEVRAGLTAYMKQGWVSNDGWSEAGSRTLDYAFNDYACSVVAAHAGEDNDTVEALRKRSANFAHLWSNETQFMRSRNANGTWANNTFGWTEGDDWVYTFDVMHDVKGLAALFGSRRPFRDKLDAHFQGGHNDHTNEPSHHVPYFYSTLGYPNQAAETIRDIAWSNYNATSGGLGGNEDLGQMSAWYVFSALGFYPVNPASDQYIVGTPFFEHVSIRLASGASTGGDIENGREKTLEICAPGAATKPYVRSLRVDGKRINAPVLTHRQIVHAARIEYEMSETPTSWGNRPLWELLAL